MHRWVRLVSNHSGKPPADSLSINSVVSVQQLELGRTHCEKQPRAIRSVFRGFSNLIRQDTSSPSSYGVRWKKTQGC
jgi:hypothetical protein